MLLLTTNPSTGLVYDLEDPDSSYATPDIPEFIRLDRYIYEAETMEKVDSWLGRIGSPTV